MSDTCGHSIGHVPGLYTFYDTNSFVFIILLLLYKYLETLLYTVFMTTLFNGNYIYIYIYFAKIDFFKSKKVALLALIVNFLHDVLYVKAP